MGCGFARGQGRSAEFASRTGPEGRLVISRVWHGWTTSANAPAYEQLLRTEILPGIAAKRLPGYHGAHLLRRPVDGEVEFVTILWFESLEGVRALAGEDYETAYVPPRARAVLSRFDARSQHYETILAPDRTGGTGGPRD
jgi:heme-degrading monooxygenase HmoA